MQRDNAAAENEENNEGDKSLETWPHKFNSALACLGCTLGVFSVDRFAIHSVQFGVHFIIQFLILSLIFGIPLFTLQVCLGQRLKAGALSMWKISPLFQGIGIALLIVQSCIGIYNIVGVSWLLVYLRDSFITRHETYRWAQDFTFHKNDMNVLKNSTPNTIFELTSSYFNRVVLQRKDLNEQHSSMATLKFQVAFNLAVMWTIVFFSLCRGLYSYGKVIYFYTLIPLFCNLIFFIKILNLMPQGPLHKTYTGNFWREFLINGKSWTAAMSEAFFIWGLLGAAAMQIAVHNQKKHLVKRDTLFVVIFTVLILLINAFIANTSVEIFKLHGYIFATPSEETTANGKSLRYLNQQATFVFNNTYEKQKFRTFFLPTAIESDTDLIKKYGNQILRYSTGLVPSTVALIGSQYFTAFWTVLFYLTLILFGIAQQLAIWNCVIMGILSVNTRVNETWKTRVTFFSCICGFILGLPMATELGSYVIYYLDCLIARSWWIVVLYLIQFGIVFGIRGRPCNSKSLLEGLFLSSNKFFQHWVGPGLSFSWNITLPLMLMILSVIIFNNDHFGELYFNHKLSQSYWTVWSKQIGIMIQLLPLFIILGVAIIQTFRYLSSGPADISKRFQLLCRPPLELESNQQVQDCANDTTSNNRENEGFQSTTDLIIEDSPPKYTPPPSYTTATGARMAKMLRQSFRRSIRRIGNILSDNNALNPKPTRLSPPEYKL